MTLVAGPAKPQKPRSTLAGAYFGLNERLYERWARAFDPLAQVMTLGRFRRWRRSALAFLSGKRVLEVGHGSGDLLVQMALHGLHPVGLERSPAMQLLATRRLERGRVAVPCVVGDARALPFMASSFDSVVVTFPTDYATEPEVLADFRRVLCEHAGQGDAGRIVLVGVCLDSDFPIVRMLLAWIFGRTQARLQTFVTAMTAAGLRAEVHASEDSFLKQLTVVGHV